MIGMTNNLFYDVETIKKCLAENGYNWDGYVFKWTFSEVRQPATLEDFPGQGYKVVNLKGKNTDPRKKYTITVSNMTLQIGDTNVKSAYDVVTIGKFIDDLSLEFMTTLLEDKGAPYLQYLKERRDYIANALKDETQFTESFRTQLKTQLGLIKKAIKLNDDMENSKLGK